MFYAMARDLQHNGYRLPEFTTYNSANIPFTYPPLGFYASALIDDLTPLSLVQVFRWLPLIATCLTLPAFYLLAKSMLTSRVALVASVLAFALVPRSFMWLLMGGGVTRSLGFLFAILALYCVHRL
jgi:4-amino-4-deoxy-L-arabinose transferase-like glycosyltransferase